jgi:hypothetical protein
MVKELCGFKLWLKVGIFVITSTIDLRSNGSCFKMQSCPSKHWFPVDAPGNLLLRWAFLVTYFELWLIESTKFGELRPIFQFYLQCQKILDN